MRMLFYKEWLALKRDSRLLSLVLSLIVLFVAVSTITHYQSERSLEEKKIAEQAMRAQWEHQGDKHPHRGAHLGVYVFAPESSLSAFDPGINHHTGEALWLEPHKRNMMRFVEGNDNAISNSFGEFTPAFILISILPLLIIGMTFNAISLEKESGTLRMLRGAGQNPYDVVFAKFAMQLLAITVLLLVAISPMLLVVLIKSDTILWEAILQGFVLFLAYVLYCTVFIAIGLVISTYASSSRQALMALVGIWVLFVLIVPRIAATTANVSVSLPSATQFWETIQRDYQNGLPGDGNYTMRMSRFESDLLQKYKAETLDDLPVGVHALKRIHQEEYSNKVHEVHFNELWDKYIRQEELVRGFSALSPTVVIRLLSMKLSATDLTHRRHFEEQAEIYRRYYVKHVDAWDANHSKGLTSYGSRYGNDALWQSVEGFTYRQPDFGFVLRNATQEIGYLSVWVCMSIILLLLSVRRIYA
jgi:ABC-2 type transport system permease protein